MKTKQVKHQDIKDMDEQVLIEFIEKLPQFENAINRDIELAAAMVRMLELDEDELMEMKINDTEIEVRGEEYLAGDDDEMDEAWDADLDNYIDDCVMCEIPETYQMYFDREHYKRDCKFDGRAHSLARYDGLELYQDINKTAYYAYRTN